MVVPMRKYAFLVHRADYSGFLDELRRLGVLHVREKKQENAEGESEHVRDLKNVDSAIRLLAKHENKTEEDAGPLESIGGMELAKRIWDLQEESERTRQQLQLLKKELSGMAPWGEFSLEGLSRLAGSGWQISFFISPLRKFQKEWEEKYYLAIINTVPPDVYFVIVHRPEEKPEIDAEEIPIPKHAPAELRAVCADIEKRLGEIDRTLDGYAAHYMPLLEETQSALLEKVDWDNVVASTGKEAEGAVMVLEGFVPKPQEEKLKTELEARGVVYVVDHPVPEDKPPVLLKNNWYSRLFEPIGKLFSLPAYAELDLTPFFAPFFMMFFGFCLGDAGYGLVILSGATIYKPWAKENLKPILTLAQFLGIATILFGALTGTVFGLNLLQEQYAWLGEVRNYMVDSDQAFNLALILGLVQIMFGLVLQAANRARQYSFQYAVPSIGWMILLLSILDLAVLKMTGPVSTYTAWAGVALIVLFSDPKAGILGRIGKGLWDLYGITGFFGDLLSYIRLFALGISSAILGFVVNDIAFQIKGSMPIVGPVLFVLFLVVGHGANLLISSLGSFVHPMRLTFVEFYKNAGFQGGGKAYQPFASRKQNNNNQNTK